MAIEARRTNTTGTKPHTARDDTPHNTPHNTQHSTGTAQAQFTDEKAGPEARRKGKTLVGVERRERSTHSVSLAQSERHPEQLYVETESDRRG